MVAGVSGSCSTLASGVGGTPTLNGVIAPISPDS